MHSVKVKRPSATDQRRYKATISGSVEAKLLFSTKMVKLPRRNHNNKCCCWPGARLGGSWFCRGEIAEICRSERSAEAKRYRRRYPLPTTIILLDIIIVQQQQQPSHSQGRSEYASATSTHYSHGFFSHSVGGNQSSQCVGHNPHPAIPPYYIKSPHCMAPRRWMIRSPELLNTRIPEFRNFTIHALLQSCIPALLPSGFLWQTRFPHSTHPG